MKTTHLIILGGQDQDQVSFECTNGIAVLNKLKNDFLRAGGVIDAQDDFGFIGAFPGNERITYTMIGI